jgi:hypothetical protein
VREQQRIPRGHSLTPATRACAGRHP